MSEFSRIAAIPAFGQVPDIVFRSWTAPSRPIGTMASWRGISTASPLPRSAKAASIASMQSGILSSGSTSSLVRRIIAGVPVEISGATIVHRGRAAKDGTWRSAEHSRARSACSPRRSDRSTADSVSPAAIEQAKLLLLDTIGCGFAGRREPVAQAALTATAASTGPCAVIGQTARTEMTERRADERRPRSRSRSQRLHHRRSVTESPSRADIRATTFRSLSPSAARGSAPAARFLPRSSWATSSTRGSSRPWIAAARGTASLYRGWSRLRSRGG